LSAVIASFTNELTCTESGVEFGPGVPIARLGVVIDAFSAFVARALPSRTSDIVSARRTLDFPTLGVPFVGVRARAGSSSLYVIARSRGADESFAPVTDGASTRRERSARATSCAKKCRFCSFCSPPHSSQPTALVQCG